MVYLKSVENVITLIDRPVVFILSPPLYFVFEKHLK